MGGIVGCGLNRFLGLYVCVSICTSVSATCYLLAVYLCYSSVEIFCVRYLLHMSIVKISVSVLCYLCVYVCVGVAALTSIRVLKMGCFL